MMASGRYKAVLLGSLCTLALFWLLHFQYYDEVAKLAPERFTKFFGGNGLANSTLGFGAIIANSAEDQNDPKSWRRRGLIEAANRTGIDIRIAPQPLLNQTALDILMTVGTGPYPKPGSAKAYYAYLELLEQFLESDLETVLLVEDDVDWELDIRKMLAPRAGIARGIREATNAKDDIQAYPFGREWDVLWLGHCGFQERHGDRVLLVQGQDTIPNNQMRSIFGQDPYNRMPENSREVHTRMAAMCTFALGVTKPWARKFLQGAYRGGVKGFDYATNVWCGSGGIRCVGVRPEVMHQQKAIGGGYHSEIDKVGLAAGVGLPPGPPVVAENVHFFTFNMKHSARCNVGRADNDRTNCPPTPQEWKDYGA